MKFFKIPALLGLSALALVTTACLNDKSNPAGARDDEARLVIMTGVKDVNNVRALGKTSVISLRKLIITLASSNPADSARRDTVLADTGASFVSNATIDQVFLRNYSVKALRNWTVTVKTLDANDSVIHFATKNVDSLLAGETRAVTVDLESRFVMYEAKFTLPDSINFQLSQYKEELTVNRVVLRVDGEIVADSTHAPRFEPGSPTPIVHTVRFDYVRRDQTPDVKVEFYGRIGDYPEDDLLFEVEFENVNPDVPNPTPKTPEYVGPPVEELFDPATIGLKINIGKVGTVVFDVNIDGDVFAKPAAE